MDWEAGFDNAFSDVFRGRNLLLLVASWLGGVLVFVVYGVLSGPLVPCEAYVAHPSVAPEGNETGAVAARRHDDGAGSRYRYRIAFDNLSAQDNSAGVFRTASSKRIRIDNLHVAFKCSGTICGADSWQHVGWSEFHDLFAPRQRGDSQAGQLGILDEFGSGGDDWSARVDLANATEVEIHNLIWEVRDGYGMDLRVQCRLARLQCATSRVTLCGRVTLAASGVTLESNHVEMNVHDETLVVPGRYVLTDGGRREAGSGMCFDRALRIIDATVLDAGGSQGWARGLPLRAF